MVSLLGHTDAIRGLDPLAQMGGLALDFIARMVPSPLGLFLVLGLGGSYILATVRADPILGADSDQIGRDYLSSVAERDPVANLVDGHRRTNLIDTAQPEAASEFRGSDLEERFLCEYELGPVLMLALWDQASAQHCVLFLARSRDDTEFSQREKSFLRQVAPLLTQSYHCAIGIGGMSTPVPGTLAAALTPRELEIALLAAHGARNSEIAERLSIAPGTVKAHMHSIYAKLGVDSRVHLALGLGLSH